MREREEKDDTDELTSEGYVSLHARSGSLQPIAPQKQALSTPSGRASNDRSLIQHLLNYADTLCDGRNNSTFHFIAFAITRISTREPELGDQLLQSIESKAAADVDFRDDLVKYFAPVVDEGHGRDFHHCLLVLRRRKTTSVLGRRFAGRVRHAGEPGYRRFLLGFSQYLRRVESDPEARLSILERVGLIAAGIGIGVLSEEGTAEAATKDTVPATDAAPTSTVKPIHFVLSLAIGVVAVLSFYTCERCTDSEPQSTVGHEESATIQDQRRAKLPSRSLLPSGEPPSECAKLPRSPERKSCLIRAADASRKEFQRARLLYELAVEARYDVAGVGPHTIDNGYVGGFAWSESASSDSLLKAQTFQALAGLSSMFALHEDFTNAAAAWDRALRISQSGGGHVFGPGPSRFEYHIKNFLDRMAGLKVHVSECGYQIFKGMSRCHVERGFQMFDSGRWVEALDDLTYAIGEMGDPAGSAAPDGPAASAYWRGLLPTASAIVQEAHRDTNAILNKLEEKQQAIALNGIVFWLKDPGTICSKVLTFPWSQDCDGNIDVRGWNLSLRINGIEATRGSTTSENPLMSRLPIDKTSRVTTVSDIVRISGEIPAECGHSQAEILVCRNGSLTTLRTTDSSCN